MVGKKSYLLEKIIKKPCNKCLVKACCKSMCDLLYEWNVKNSTLICLNDIVMILLGTIYILLLRFISLTHLINKEKEIAYIDKIIKEVEENIK